VGEGDSGTEGVMGQNGFGYIINRMGSYTTVLVERKVDFFSSGF